MMASSSSTTSPKGTCTRYGQEKLLLAGELTHLGRRALPFSFDRWAVTASRRAQTPEQPRSSEQSGNLLEVSHFPQLYLAWHFPPTCDKTNNSHRPPPAHKEESHDVKLGSTRLGKSAAPGGLTD